MGVMDAALFEAPAEGGPRPPPAGRPHLRDPQGTGPLINAPWAAAAVAVSMIGLYLLQSRFPLEVVARDYGFAPWLLGEGEWQRLITYNLVHGGWAHALMNAAFGLAFGAPVARFFGERFSGVFLFFAFYLACGVLAALGYTAIHPGGQQLMIGASGAVSGLMGAAARVIAGRGDVGPMFSRPVFALGAGWLAINLVLALVGGAMMPGSGGAGVAWEAHLTGFVAGVIAIGPFAWISRRA